MINGLLNRKSLARTSSTPGKTRTINFYSINDTFRFVDLPGYGYAAVSTEEQNRYAAMINEYLYERPNLKEVFLLVDIRHKPSKQDEQMYEWLLHAGFGGHVIATKADKVAKTKVPAECARIKKQLQMAEEGVILPFSTVKKIYREDILDQIEELLIDEQ